MNFDRRTYARLYARRQRDAKLDAARRNQTTCPKRYGKHGRCNGILEAVVLPGGGWRLRCERCERFNAGLCLDCGRPVDGQPRKARRCAFHTEAERVAAYRRYKDRNRAEVNRKAKIAARLRMADPVIRAQRLAQKRAWREKNVVRIKLSKRKWRLNPERPNGYSSRAKYEAYHRAYNIKRGWTMTPKEALMRGTERAIKVLESTAAKTREKLAGMDALQKELAQIEQAITALRAIGAPESRRGRPAKVA